MQKDYFTYWKSPSPHQPKEIVSGQVEYIRTRKNPDENATKYEKYVPAKIILTDAQFLEGCDDEVKTIYSHGFDSICSQNDYAQEGLDKIELIINKDYVNEHCYLFKSLRNGSVTLRNNGQYFYITIHRESIKLEENILQQIYGVVWKLMDEGLFKIPLNIKVLDYATGEIVVERKEMHHIEDVRNAKDFYDIIISHLSLSCIEWYCDIQWKGGVADLFDHNQFNLYKSTFYSKDYKYYDSNRSKQKSLLCIYDKSAQLREVKKLSMKEETTRMEFRLRKSFHREMFSSLDVLDGTYDEFLTKIQKHLVKKVKMLGIDFGRFLSACELPQSFRMVLEKAGSSSKGLVEKAKLSREEREEKKCCAIKTHPHGLRSLFRDISRGLIPHFTSSMHGLRNWVKKYPAKKCCAIKTLLWTMMKLAFVGGGIGCLEGFSLYVNFCCAIKTVLLKFCCAIKICGIPPRGMFHIRGP
jgi:hypothetical protein